MLPTIIIVAVIAAMFAYVIVNSIIKKKKGQGGCSCGCGGCDMRDICHEKKE